MAEVPGTSEGGDGDGRSMSSFTSYQSTATTTTYLGQGPPLRYVLSGIKSTLSYPETVGILLIVLLVPSLTEPVIACRETHLLTHILMVAMGLTLAFLFAGFIAAFFGELHHYYHDCGGLVSIAQNVCGVGFSRVILAVVLSASVMQVAYSLTSLSDLIERQTDYYFADNYENTILNSKLDIPALLALLFLFIVSILGVSIVSRAAVVLGPLLVVSLFLIGGYGIHHSLGVSSVVSIRSIGDDYVPDNDNPNITKEQAFSERTETYMVAESSNIPVDKSLGTYAEYLGEIMAQVVVVTLLVSLTEDNKLKKPVMNAVGGGAMLFCFATILFVNLALAHITSDTDVFMDQIGVTVGIRTEVILAISIISGISLMLRSILILYSTCRVMVYIAVSREEYGVGGVPCKILKLPIFVNGCQCFLVAGVLLLGRPDVCIFNLVLIFFYVGLGGICHLIHRYKTDTVSETSPILGSMGSLRPQNTIRILLVLLIIACILLCVTGVIDDTYINTGPYGTWQSKAYVIMRICLALLVIGAISVIASFQQQTNIHKTYRWLVWTPLIPSLAILMSCVVGTYFWLWGAVSVGLTLFLSALILAYDKLYTHCCCVTIADNASTGR